MEVQMDDQQDSPVTVAYFTWLQAQFSRRPIRGRFAGMTQARPDLAQEQRERERAEQVNRINRVQDPT
jgi:hypothetical protein